MRKTKHYFGRNHYRKNPQKKSFKAVYPPGLFHWFGQYRLAIRNYNRLSEMCSPLSELGYQQHAIVKTGLDQALESKSLPELKKANEQYYKFVFALAAEDCPFKSPIDPSIFSDGPIETSYFTLPETIQGGNDA